MAAGPDDATFQQGGVSGGPAASAAELSQRPGPKPRSTATAAGAAPASNGSPAPTSAAVPRQRRRDDRVPPVPGPAPRPRIVEEPSILGLSRRSRGRLGSRLFTLFFVLVYAVILLDLINSLMHP